MPPTVQIAPQLSTQTAAIYAELTTQPNQDILHHLLNCVSCAQCHAEHALCSNICCMHYRTPGYLLLLLQPQTGTIMSFAPSVPVAAAEAPHTGPAPPVLLLSTTKAGKRTHCCSCARAAGAALVLVLLRSKPGTAHSDSSCCCLVALGDCVPVDQLVHKGGHVVGPAASSSSSRQQQQPGMLAGT